MQPRIYVACLASYNAGILHGAWIDAAQTPEEVYAEIGVMLKDSPEKGDAEEYAIHDHQGFYGLPVTEYMPIDEVCALANMLEDSGNPEAFAAYASNIGVEYATLEGFQESYMGEWYSMADYAEDYLDSLYDVPEWVAPYFDYERFGRDMEMDGYWTAPSENCKVHVFCVN